MVSLINIFKSFLSLTKCQLWSAKGGQRKWAFLFSKLPKCCFWSEADVVVWPEFGLAKKLKSTKSYLLQTFWWWIATKDWMNIEMNNSWLFDIIIKALTKKINFLLIDKKLKNHSVWAGLFKKVLNKSGPNLSQVYNLVSRKFKLIWNWKRRDG